MRSKFWNKVIVVPVVKNVLHYFRTVSFPGFENNSIYEVGKYFAQSIQKEGIRLRSSSMAFSFFLSIFPSILFLLTLLPFIPIPGLELEVFLQLESILPTEAFKTLESTVLDIIVNQNGSILSIGFVSFLYFSSNGIQSMIAAFNKRHPILKKGFFLKNRIKSIGIVLFLAIQFLLGIILIIYSTSLIEWSQENLNLAPVLSHLLISFFKYIFLFLIVLATIAALYHFCSNVETKYRLFTTGGILSTILSLVTTNLFSYYVDNFGSYNKIYGSLGAIIGLMILIYINCSSILIGYELNSSISDAKTNKHL
jgi:membrane protein